MALKCRILIYRRIDSEIDSECGIYVLLIINKFYKVVLLT